MESHITNTPLIKEAWKPRQQRFANVQCFLNADLRYSLPGLLELCGKHSINVKDYGPGRFIPFVNTKMDLIKVIICNGTEWPLLTTIPLPPELKGSKKFDLSIVMSRIPQALGLKGKVDIKDEMNKALNEKLGRTLH